MHVQYSRKQTYREGYLLIQGYFPCLRPILEYSRQVWNMMLNIIERKRSKEFKNVLFEYPNLSYREALEFKEIQYLFEEEMKYVRHI